MIEEGRYVSLSGLVPVDELVCKVFDHSWMLVSGTSSVSSELNVPIVDIHLKAVS